MGNLVVRLTGPEGPLQSPIVDWIHLSFYPETFNLADVAIRAGLLATAVGLLVDRKRRRAEPTLCHQARTQSATPVGEPELE